MIQRTRTRPAVCLRVVCVRVCSRTRAPAPSVASDDAQTVTQQHLAGSTRRGCSEICNSMFRRFRIGAKPAADVMPSMLPPPTELFTYLLRSVIVTRWFYYCNLIRIRNTRLYKLGAANAFQWKRKQINTHIGTCYAAQTLTHGTNTATITVDGNNLFFCYLACLIACKHTAQYLIQTFVTYRFLLQIHLIAYIYNHPEIILSASKLGTSFAKILRMYNITLGARWHLEVATQNSLKWIPMRSCWAWSPQSS
jgi:hypothetical protein